MKGKFCPRPSNFFKIVRTSCGVIIFQDFGALSLQNDAFHLQTGRSGRPVLTNGKHSDIDCSVVCGFFFLVKVRVENASFMQ